MPLLCPKPAKCSSSPRPVVLQLCGALAPCQAAEEFLQSLLGSVSCHVLSLKHPGSARFLLSPEGQHLLRGMEAQFQCVFGTERLARAALDTDLGEVDMEPSPPLFHSSAPPYLLHPCSEAWEGYVSGGYWHSFPTGGPH